MSEANMEESWRIYLDSLRQAQYRRDNKVELTPETAEIVVFLARQQDEQKPKWVMVEKNVFRRGRF